VYGAFPPVAGEADRDNGALARIWVRPSIWLEGPETLNGIRVEIDTPLWS
jgi:hypothetical protein